MDHGSLQQLRDLINRRNVVSEVKKNVHACEDFLTIVVQCHILVGALKYLNMNSLDDCEKIDENEILKLNDKEKQAFLYSITSSIIDEYVDLSLFDEDETRGQSSDSVYEYAKDVINLGLLYMELIDAIKEGDGTRVLRWWKYAMVIFKVTGHKNYSMEALTLLSQYQ